MFNKASVGKLYVDLNRITFRMIVQQHTCFMRLINRPRALMYILISEYFYSTNSYKLYRIMHLIFRLQNIKVCILISFFQNYRTYSLPFIIKYDSTYFTENLVIASEGQYICSFPRSSNNNYNTAFGTFLNREIKCKLFLQYRIWTFLEDLWSCRS